MSKSAATARARALRDELVERGVPTSIELQQGRPGTPNGRWYDTRFIGTMGHHIVSRRSQGLTPGLALVKRGRSDVPGPLCNGYLGFDGRARIICMGWANHPGAGGAYTLPGGRIPQNTGRPYLFGWEIEGGLSESDWPASFRTLMGKVHAATLAWLGRDERSHIEHKTWAPSRKIDRLNYTLSSARSELRPHLSVSTPPGDPLMAISGNESQVLAKIADAVLDRVLDKVDPNSGSTPRMRVKNMLRHAHYRGNQISVHQLPEMVATQERIESKVEALLGGGHDEVLSRIAANHAETLAALTASAERETAQLELIEEALSGERDASDTLRALRDLIDTAVGDGADPDDDGEA